METEVIHRKSRFIFYSRSLWLFVLMLLLGMLKLPSQSAPDLPNILWLVTEDNSKHFLKLYEEGGAPMPNIEALAKKGIVFNNAFSNSPVCSVARSTLISGCYAPRVGAQYHRRMQLAPMPNDLQMFPHYLRQRGYRTSNNAKEDYNFVKSDLVWDDSSRKATYRDRKPGQPFFHVQNFGTTHEGQLHFSQEEMQNTATTTPVNEVPLFPYHPDTPTYRYTNARYRDLHRKVDREIGAFLEQMKGDGLMENTIIFYYGDHGGALPRSKGYIYESGLNVPLVVYVPDKWKHLAPVEMGTSSDAFVQFIDFAPTVLNLAGIAVPDQMDGKPFLGKGVTSKNLDQRNTTFGHADRFDEKYDLVRSLRKGKYKYIRNYQPFNIDALFNFYRYKMLAYKEWQERFENGKLTEVQRQFFETRGSEALYDIDQDPHEIHNLAKDPSFQMVLKELRSELQGQVKSMPDLSFYPEPYFLKKGLSDPVDFGQRYKTRIGRLVTIADLGLVPFKEAEKGLEIALKSAGPWERYWALITCSTFGRQAETFFKEAANMAKNDKENLVRLRAVEFLALNDRPVEANMLLEIMENATSEAEANLILNSIALIKMVKHDFKMKIPRNIFPSDWLKKEGDLVNRRIEFINSDPK